MKNVLMITLFAATAVMSAVQADATERTNAVLAGKPAVKAVRAERPAVKSIPNSGTGADEHGCIPPQIWHAGSQTCVTDILPNNSASGQEFNKE